MGFLLKVDRPAEKLGYALLAAIVGIGCWIYQRSNGEATRHSLRGMQRCLTSLVVVGFLFLALSRWNVGVH
jgi:uncharacterized membrane protein